MQGFEDYHTYLLCVDSNYDDDDNNQDDFSERHLLIRRPHQGRWKLLSNSKHFSPFMNSATVSLCLKAAGSPFQLKGPATPKARSEKLDLLALLGTTIMFWECADERRGQRSEVSGVHSSDRQMGACPCNALKTVRHNLKATLSSTRNQWRALSSGVIRQLLLSP